MTTLKLSEAIRLGAMLRPQTYGDYVNVAGTCALGSAYEAVKGDPCNCDDDELRALWPILMERVPIPIAPHLMGSVIGVIIDLNDTHHWTRERIADWIATVEQQQEQQVAPDLTVAVTVEAR